jgi:hypothetical protein
MQTGMQAIKNRVVSTRHRRRQMMKQQAALHIEKQVGKKNEKR